MEDFSDLEVAFRKKSATKAASGDTCREEAKHWEVRQRQPIRPYRMRPRPIQRVRAQSVPWLPDVSTVAAVLGYHWLARYRLEVLRIFATCIASVSVLEAALNEGRICLVSVSVLRAPVSGRFCAIPFHRSSCAFCSKKESARRQSGDLLLVVAVSSSSLIHRRTRHPHPRTPLPRRGALQMLAPLSVA